jgi:hypothetical protein
LEAYTALGGDEDRGGFVSAERIKQVIRYVVCKNA